MNKKRLKLIGIILAFAFCFPLHFLYEKFPNFITGIFSPVNESIWEHMKVLFGGILLSGIIQKIIVVIKKEDYNNVCISNFLAALASIPIFLIMYLPLYYTFGENMTISITVMLISIIIAEIIAYKIMNMEELHLESKTLYYAIATYAIFTLLTYYPIETELFLDPKSLTYGINKFR